MKMTMMNNMPKEWKKNLPEEVVSKINVDPNETKMFAAELGGTAPRLDLHDAQDTQDGVAETESFLHRSFQDGIEVVEIIHGRGSGKMREAVHELLRDNPIVETFRDSNDPSRNMGSTFVVLITKE